MRGRKEVEDVMGTEDEWHGFGCFIYLGIWVMILPLVFRASEGLR